MNVTDYKEVWQIDAGGQVYEASFEEMARWIYEGTVLPQDRVRRGNLRWIEARKVPVLTQFFNAKERGEPPPVFTSTTGAPSADGFRQTAPTENFGAPATVSDTSFQATFNQPVETVWPPAETSFEPPVNNFHNQSDWPESAVSIPAAAFNEPAAHEFNLMPTADFCSMHPDAPSAFLCGTCGNGFCPACPKSYGGSVKICPFCGAMCKSVKEVQAKSEAAFQYERDISKGFGAGDFFNALAYPFKYKTSLFVGAIMFMLFTLGQSAGKMGSIFLAGAGLICWMMSNMLTFGVLANTIENFAQGRIGGNFMPSFEDFSLWDDVVHPFFLSLAVYIVSFGLVVVIIAGSIVWGLNQVSNALADTSQPGHSQLETDENGILRKNPQFQRQDQMYGDGEMPDGREISELQTRPGDTEEDVRRANEMINQYQKKRAESIVGKAPETERAERDMMIRNFMKSALPLLLLSLAGVLWGIFYFPAACCVAGYTRSFVATLNPRIGLETIRLLGWDYVKIWFMGLVLGIASLFVGMILALIFMPFDMPTVGNVPANAVGALFGFYFSVVFSVILGFALYKNADKMNLFKG